MMRTSLCLSILLMGVSAVSTAEESAAAPGIEALLGFTNGDQLHGRYLGFTEDRRLLWEREDLASAPEFNLSNIRRVVLRNGRPEAAVPAAAHANTTHGDRIPGDIISLDDDQLVLDTNFAGALTIPRDQIESLAPNPYGGTISYQGPFRADEWEMIEAGGQVLESDDSTADEEAGEAAGDVGAGGWAHSGAAWYWPGKGDPTAIVRRDGVPESTIIRCHVAWKSRVSLAIGFHADFRRPPEVAEGGEDEGNPRPQQRRFHPGDNRILADVFGNSYVLQLNPTHAMMFRATMDDEGNTSVDRMEASFNNMRLGDSGTALVEIRASRPTGDISLFINDEFVAQWSEIGHLHDGAMANPYVGAGNGLGFLMQSPDSFARITDVTVAEWNGMPDSARSLQSNDHDIVLLTNGADRFSGKVNGISDGRLLFSGRYGEFDFPINEIAEIRFARTSVASGVAAPQNQIRLRLHPHGILTGTPLIGDAGHIRLDHPLCGPITVGLQAVVIIDMHEGHSFLDAWDPDF